MADAFRCLFAGSHVSKTVEYSVGMVCPKIIAAFVISDILDPSPVTDETPGFDNYSDTRGRARAGQQIICQLSQWVKINVPNPQPSVQLFD